MAIRKPTVAELIALAEGTAEQRARILWGIVGEGVTDVYAQWTPTMTRLIDDGVDVADIDGPDPELWAPWSETINSYVDQVTVDAMSEAAWIHGARVTDTPDWTLPNPRAMAALDGLRNQLVGVPNDEWDRYLKPELIDGVAKGDSIDDLALRLDGKVDEFYRGRARTIARTTVIGVTNAATDEVGRQFGLGAREWLATGDGRTRASHVAASGQTRDPGDPFIVGGYELAYPGDPNGPAHEVINCRCTMLFPEATIERTDDSPRRPVSLVALDALQRASHVRDTLPATARWLDQLANRSEKIGEKLGKLQWRNARENWVRQGFNKLTAQYDTIVKQATEVTLRHTRGSSDVLAQLDRTISPLEKLIIKVREPTRKMRRDFRKLSNRLSTYGEGPLSPVEKRLGRGFKSVDDAVAKVTNWGREAGEGLGQVNDVLVQINEVLDEVGKTPAGRVLAGQVLDSLDDPASVNKAFDAVAKLAGDVREVDLHAIVRAQAGRAADAADPYLDGLLGPKGSLRRSILRATKDTVADAEAIFERQADRLLDAGRKLDKKMFEVVTARDALPDYNPIHGEYAAWYQRLFTDRWGRRYVNSVENAKDLERFGKWLNETGQKLYTAEFNPRRLLPEPQNIIDGDEFISKTEWNRRYRTKLITRWNRGPGKALEELHDKIASTTLSDVWLGKPTELGIRQGGYRAQLAPVVRDVRLWVDRADEAFAVFDGWIPNNPAVDTATRAGRARIRAVLDEAQTQVQALEDIIGSVDRIATAADSYTQHVAGMIRTYERLGTQLVKLSDAVVDDQGTALRILTQVLDHERDATAMQLMMIGGRLEKAGRTGQLLLKDPIKLPGDVLRGASRSVRNISRVASRYDESVQLAYDLLENTADQLDRTADILDFSRFTDTQIRQIVDLTRIADDAADVDNLINVPPIVDGKPVLGGRLPIADEMFPDGANLPDGFETWGDDLTGTVFGGAPIPPDDLMPPVTHVPPTSDRWNAIDGLADLAPGRIDIEDTTTVTRVTARFDTGDGTLADWLADTAQTAADDTSSFTQRSAIDEWLDAHADNTIFGLDDTLVVDQPVALFRGGSAQVIVGSDDLDDVAALIGRDIAGDDVVAATVDAADALTAIDDIDVPVLMQIDVDDIDLPLRVGSIDDREVLLETATPLVVRDVVEITDTQGRRALLVRVTVTEPDDVVDAADQVLPTLFEPPPPSVGSRLVDIDTPTSTTRGPLELEELTESSRITDTQTKIVAARNKPPSPRAQLTEQRRTLSDEAGRMQAEIDGELDAMFDGAPDRVVITRTVVDPDTGRRYIPPANPSESRRAPIPEDEWFWALSDEDQRALTRGPGSPVELVDRVRGGDWRTSDVVAHRARESSAGMVSPDASTEEIMGLWASRTLDRQDLDRIVRGQPVSAQADVSILRDAMWPIDPNVIVRRRYTNTVPNPDFDPSRPASRANPRRIRPRDDDGLTDAAAARRDAEAHVAEILAEHNREIAAEALDVWPTAERVGPAPWDMNFGRWRLEVVDLIDDLAEHQGVTRPQERRLMELIPPGLFVPEVSPQAPLAYLEEVSDFFTDLEVLHDLIVDVAFRSGVLQ